MVSTLYSPLSRYDPTHHLMYCENLKISSSTWATHFLSLNNVQTDPATPVHGLNRKVCPPLYGQEREIFLQTGLSFIVVRDPFQRLLSAYLVKTTVYISRKYLSLFQDKLNREYTIESKEWITFGVVQQFIKDKIRKEERAGLIPTFEEFLIFLTGTIRPAPDKQTRRINNHWKPIYFNCAPCQERSGLSTTEITLPSSYLISGGLGMTLS